MEDPHITEAIANHAEKLAKGMEEGTPGTTRVSLFLSSDGESRVTFDNHNATPLPGLNPDETHLWTLAEPMTWHEDPHREWWLSGDGVIEEGVDIFDHRRDGPADPI